MEDSILSMDSLHSGDDVAHLLEGLREWRDVGESDAPVT